jgi:hypothetical protein
MSRTLPALLLGLAFLLLYLGLVLWAGDWVQTQHWLLQVPFYVVAGIAWVVPIRALMFWAAGVRR